MANLTIEEKMELAIAKAKELRKKAKDEAKLALIDNTDYIGFKARLSEEEDTVKALQSKLDMLNKIKPIVVDDGTEYRVHAYPIAEYLFGPIMSRVLAIIVASSSMFTDERQAEFEAITGISHLVATKARDAIGSPAYYSKGILAMGIPGNGSDMAPIILSILVDLDIDTSYAVQLTKLDKWFDNALAKAQKKFDEFNKTQQLEDEDSSFKLED